MKELYQKIKEAVDNADAVLIGASNGLSISEGYNIFADDSWFQENFGDFRSRYGIHSVLEGSFYHFPSVEAKWAFSSRLISRKCYLEQPGRMMKDLHALVVGKDCFVVTSNTEDHFVPAGFSREQVFEMEGRMTQSRCSSGCCEDVYENRDDVLCMAEAEKNGLVPTELIPRCPRCGSPLIVNFADRPVSGTVDFSALKPAGIRNAETGKSFRDGGVLSPERNWSSWNSGLAGATA